MVARLVFRAASIIALLISSWTCTDGVISRTSATATQHSLSVSVTGEGTVTSAPAGISCGTSCSAEFAAGTTVTLTATPSSGSQLAGFGGACSGIDSCTVIMSADTQVTAAFAAVGGSAVVTFVLIDAAGGPMAGYAPLTSGTTLDLNTLPAFNVQASTSPSVVGSVVFGLDSTASLRVVNSPPYDLADGIWTPTVGSHTITATPYARPDGGGTAGTPLTINISVIEPPPGNATLTINLAGSGTVTSSPAGIDCGATCSANFAASTPATLTSVAGSDYAFTGWSGSGISCSGTGNCTVTMSASLTVTATFTKQTQNGTLDLCAGLVTDRLDHPMTSVTQPAVGHTFVDPQFGTTIRRITDAKTAGTTNIGVVYPTMPAWNADESYMVLYHSGGNDGQALYDGHTYQFLRMLDIAPSDIEQYNWDPTDPDIFYYPTNSENGNKPQLIRYHVSTSTKDVLHDFSNIGACASQGVTEGTDPFWISWASGSRAIGLMCGTTLFTYNIATDAVSSLSVNSNTNEASPIAAPSGKVFYLEENNGVVVDPNIVVLRNLDMLVPYEHQDIGSLANGDDVLSRVAYDPGPTGAPVGILIITDLNTGTDSELISETLGYPYPGAVLISQLAWQATPGWVALSNTGDCSSSSCHTGATVLNDEIVLVNENNRKVCRLAHHRGFGEDGPQGYWAQVNVNISPSGTRVAFNSDWGGGSNSDTYVIELSSYVP